MCPACYINGFIFLIFGASGAAIASNPVVMFIAAILTIVGFYWMWKAWKRRSKGKVMKNIKTTIIFILIFGASGAAIASNPYVMLIATILTLVGFYWMWKAWKRRTKGKVMKNIKTTIIFILIFAAGFITASFITHGYFKNIYENKASLALNQSVNFS